MAVTMQVGWNQPTLLALWGIRFVTHTTHGAAQTLPEGNTQLEKLSGCCFSKILVTRSDAHVLRSKRNGR